MIFMPLKGKAQPFEATDVIKRFNSTLIESMQKAKLLKFKGRYELLKPVVKESFALPFMTRKSIGRFWKTLENKQKERLIELYTDWSVSTYAQRFDNYSGESFQILRKTKSVRSTVTVISQLNKPNGKTIDFFYKLRLRQGNWQIVDIQISGVSQIALTRSQFLSIIKREGYEALISKLQEKIEALSTKADE